MDFFFHFFASFNIAYNNRFRFFFYRKFIKLNDFLNLFQKRGLILGFFFINKQVVIYLKYINDLPFFKIFAITKRSRRIYYTKNFVFKGKIANNDLYLLNSSKEGFFFSDSFFKLNLKEKFEKKTQGGEVFLKISFFNDCTKKNSFF